MLNVAHRRPTPGSQKIDRNAFNAAFYELGFRWHWDVDTYDSLAQLSCDEDRVRSYFETRQPHLLKAYDAEFLIGAVLAAKARCYESMNARGARSAPWIDWAEINCVEVGA